MKFEVMEDFKIKTTSKGIIELSRGQVIEISPAQAQKLADKIRPLPHIDHSGTLIIPFNSPPEYHWWNRGQSVCDTLKELGRCDLIEKYKSLYSDN